MSPDALQLITLSLPDVLRRCGLIANFNLLPRNISYLMARGAGSSDAVNDRLTGRAFMALRFDAHALSCNTFSQIICRGLLLLLAFSLLSATLCAQTDEKAKLAAALRAAQVSLMKEQSWQAPFYWAAFTLQGEWR